MYQICILSISQTLRGKNGRYGGRGSIPPATPDRTPKWHCRHQQYMFPYTFVCVYQLRFVCGWYGARTLGSFKLGGLSHTTQIKHRFLAHKTLSQPFIFRFKHSTKTYIVTVVKVSITRTTSYPSCLHRCETNYSGCGTNSTHTTPTSICLESTL